mmetsp:Transcript_1913/g.7628  ORF Transcript_1913/g.7628 Transcript_1913/m.7628 type:complete len:468 (+) Transcript_1913:121-1524(+)
MKKSPLPPSDGVVDHHAHGLRRAVVADHAQRRHARPALALLNRHARLGPRFDLADRRARLADDPPDHHRGDDAQNRGGLAGLLPGLERDPAGLALDRAFFVQPRHHHAVGGFLQTHLRESLLGILSLLLGLLRGFQSVALSLDLREARSLGFLRRGALLRRQRVRASSGRRQTRALFSLENRLLVVAVDVALVVAERVGVHRGGALDRCRGLHLRALLSGSLRRLRGLLLRELALRLHALLLGHARHALAELLLVLRVRVRAVAPGGFGGLGLGLGDGGSRLLGRASLGDHGRLLLVRARLLVGGRDSLLLALALLAFAAAAAAAPDAVLAHVHQQLLDEVGALADHLLHLGIAQRVVLEVQRAHLLLLELPERHGQVANLVVAQEQLREQRALAHAFRDGRHRAPLRGERHEAFLGFERQTFQRTQVGITIKHERHQRDASRERVARRIRQRVVRQPQILQRAALL